MNPEVRQKRLEEARDHEDSRIEWYQLTPQQRWEEYQTLSCHEVRYLLMGGQACVFYGAAEFSRDCDIVSSPTK